VIYPTNAVSKKQDIEINQYAPLRFFFLDASNPGSSSENIASEKATAVNTT
jgi:hypothetical protein